MDQPLANPLLPALIATYLARCAVEGKSPRTIDAYRETLACFLRCLREDGAPLDPDHLRPDHVIAYLALWCFKTLSALCESRPPESLRAEGRRCGSIGDCFWSGWECSAGGDGI